MRYYHFWVSCGPLEGLYEGSIGGVYSNDPVLPVQFGLRNNSVLNLQSGPVLEQQQQVPSGSSFRIAARLADSALRRAGTPSSGAFSFFVFF